MMVGESSKGERREREREGGERVVIELFVFLY